MMKEKKDQEYPPNFGKRWTSQELEKLEELANENTPTRVIGLKLGRSENAIYSKANSKGISLKPTNQSPFNKR
jgi:hypothetical protein